jgi:hypothetical protein
MVIEYEWDAAIRGPRHGGDGDIPSLLDMLRYEACHVLDWSRNEAVKGWTVRLRGPRYTPDRWASFGIATTRRA